ncbi:L-aspartate oxidase [Arthrobacter dokdonensis]|uniref:L-aspartate oxidase n=2 Tax=Arthrobacter TaxID=1663 RepID=UPI000DE59763|nr:FAD-binding protein [Arthrobacter dokdonellae]
MTARNSHLIVVGSGIAGLFSSLLAAEAGLRVTLVTKGALAQSNTRFAQGGICAVLGPDDAAPGDTVEAHVADTLAAGAGQCNPEAVRILCREACGDITALERFGVAFDRDGATGRRLLGLEGAHSAARILHAGGDATGAAIADGLIRAVRAAVDLGTVRLMEHAFVRDLVVDAGRVTGVSLLTPSGAHLTMSADAVLLATGGAGQLFDFTTNPAVATADGLAAAWRAGATVTDLEYFQFHPTALAVGENFLVSEAVRGAGAVLRDSTGTAFMGRYHPDADLAPRDVVSRSIVAHLARAGSTAGETVVLDATGVEAAHGAGYLARRFPTIDARTRELGFDWTREWLPVTPAAHYWMGGVATNLRGQTSLPGLYAAGEVACTGVHGANRLASNSLLEGLVFGRRAVESFLESTTTRPGAPRGGAGHEAAGGWPAGDEQVGAGPAAGWPAHLLALSSARSIDARSIDAVPDLDGPAVQDYAGVAFIGPSGGAALTRHQLQRLMGAHAGVVRTADGLRAAAQQLAAWRQEPRTVAPPAAQAAWRKEPGTVAPPAARTAVTPTQAPVAPAVGSAPPPAAQAEAELENLRLVAELLVHAALARENSAGAHFRGDFPEEPAPGRSPHTWVHATAGRSAHLPTSLPVLESETV